MVRSALFLILLVTHSSFADYGSMFGLGSRSMALSGAASSGEDAYLAYTQPAAMAHVLKDSKKNTIAAFSLLSASANFKSIDGVLIENNTTSDRITTGNTSVRYKGVLAQEVGFFVGTLEDLWDLTIGLSAANPMQHTLAADTGESYQPEYLLYRSRLQRPQIDLATSACPLKDWCVGFGGHLGYGLTSNASVFLQTDRTKPSSARFASTLKPTLSPYLGLQYFSDSFSSGIVVRAPSKSEATLRVDASARAFGTLAALDLSYLAQSMLFYDPLSIEWGTDAKLAPAHQLSLKVIYQLWNRYRPPTLFIEETTSSFTVTPSDVQLPEFQNTLSPRLGYEYSATENLRLRGGYGYQPSILRDTTPEGRTNYLDPTKHQFSAGAALQRGQMSLECALFYHLLQSEQVTKTNSSDIGAPGYSTGGHVIGGGITLGLSL